jgi:hypothetical protein
LYTRGEVLSSGIQRPGVAENQLVLMKESLLLASGRFLDLILHFDDGVEIIFQNVG